MSQDHIVDRTIIETRMLTNGLVIAIKILLYTVLALYFTGTYWLGFSLVFY